MNQSTKRALFFVLAGILLIAACAPTPAPTQDPAEIQRQIQESVAMTVSAQNAQTEQAQALIPEPTNTPLPTQTEAGALPSPTPVIPTATPFVVVPPTLAPSGNGGSSVTTTNPDYACLITHRRPYDDTVYKPNDTFDIKWTIINSGTKAWAKGLDVKYNSGRNMATTNFVELPAMQPGDQFEINLDGVTPDEEGTMVMVWMIEGSFCYPYVRIVVER